MTSPQYVIVHRRDNGHVVVDQIFDLHPSQDRVVEVARAAELQHDANNLYGRPRDLYRVAELRYVEEAS